MALSISPAVGRASYTKWALHVALFALGVGVGALATYACARGLFLVVGAAVSPTTWLAIALPLVGLAALRDAGVRAPVPYPSRRQVPEWVRRVLPAWLTAFLYGSQLGFGFLTRFTYSTHTAFVILLATQASVLVVAVSIILFALTKTIVVASAPPSDSYADFEDLVLRRHRIRGERVLHLTNAALAVTAAVILSTAF